MKLNDLIRGGAPVGYITNLDAVQTSAVIYLRLWCDGHEGQERTKNDFELALGVAQGSAAVHYLAQICELCIQHGRRPLMRHKVSCECHGADENCFANFIGCAVDGQNEDAMLIATLLVRPDFSPSLAGLAQHFGIALKRMSLTTTKARDVPARSAKTHSFPHQIN